MKGIELATAREKLGLTAAHLARILCVGSSTVYRWEQSEELRIDPLHRHLCLQVLGISAHFLAPTYGMALKKALNEGPTYALHTLLATGFAEWRPTNGT
jgi:transcriptional regulator with XRE-family HTH domain